MAVHTIQRKELLAVHRLKHCLAELDYLFI